MIYSKCVDGETDEIAGRCANMGRVYQDCIWDTIFFRAVRIFVKVLDFQLSHFVG